MGPSPPGGQQVVEQLQQQLHVKDAELQRKSAELLQKEAEIQRLAHGKSVCVWLWGMHWVWHV